jgi:hypothetical protein
MNKLIDESLSFLISEYKRLKLKEKNNTIDIEEQEALNKLASFIGKNNEK